LDAYPKEILTWSLKYTTYNKEFNGGWLQPLTALWSQSILYLYRNQTLNNWLLIDTQKDKIGYGSQTFILGCHSDVPKIFQLCLR